jgi:hypothetical protein
MLGTRRRSRTRCSKPSAIDKRSSAGGPAARVGPEPCALVRRPPRSPGRHGRSSFLRSIGVLRQPGIRTTSHGQTTRKRPSLVLTSMSTEPTSVMVPMRVLPSFTLSPTWNFTSVPPSLLGRLRSCALVGAASVPRKLAAPLAPMASVPIASMSPLTAVRRCVRQSLATTT